MMPKKRLSQQLSVYLPFILCSIGLFLIGGSLVQLSPTYAEGSASGAMLATCGPFNFPSAHQQPIAGWTQPVFSLSQNYPSAMPQAQAKPWTRFDFRTDAQKYLKSVLAYVLAGNVPVDFQGDQNQIRKWYHAPWLNAGNGGREFVHGLTRERSSRPGELHPSQTSTFSNYAVSMYNRLGGYTIGQVWCDPANPNAAAARFPEGTVAFKLLFTTATVNQVPYLRDSFEWQAYVTTSGGSQLSVQTVRLLQIDLAVRDSRADSTTGWIFGTYVYDADAPGNTPWKRMVPIGLMWGNDPTLTQSAFDAGARVTETVILNDLIGGVRQHLGWNGRLNGPVDNPRSSCLSCHSTAQTPFISNFAPTGSTPATQIMNWFRNIPSGDPFNAGNDSLDYSLQLAVGIRNS